MAAEPELLVVSRRIAGGRGLARSLVERAASVELDWDQRQRSRLEAVDDRGRRLGLFLPRGQVMRGGDVLVAEDGTLVRVRAAAQPVRVARPRAGPTAAGALLRAAYHLGNRHVAVELGTLHLAIEPDPVLEQMLVGLGMEVRAESLPFEPEGGAYAASAGIAHDHGHAHGHDDDGHPRAHAH